MNARLRQDIVVNGEFLPSQAIDRGDPLLTDTRRWARRAWSAQVRWCLVIVPITCLFWFGIAMLADFLLVLFLGYFFGATLLVIAIMSALVAVLYFFYNLAGLIGLRIGLRELDEGAGVPGLYSRGIQTTVGPWDGGLFIPYQEIDHIEPHRSTFFEFIDIFIKGSKLRAARLPRRFLGDNGVEALRMIIGKEPRTPAPPMLVIYPKAGSDSLTKRIDGGRRSS